MRTSQATITVDKFLGVNQASDSMRELQPGQASKAVNFRITDANNITLRQGTTYISRNDGEPAGIWCGYFGGEQYLISAVQTDGETVFSVFRDFQTVQTFSILHKPTTQIVKIFPFLSKVFICIGYEMYTLKEIDGTFYPQIEAPYIPIAIIGATPDGGGETYEPINILSEFARAEYSADGESTVYAMPVNCSKIRTVTVNGSILRDGGTYDHETNTFTFSEPPSEGTGNIEFVYSIGGTILDARNKFASMRYWEAYNGTTDSRLFFYGDGTNIAYYTGVTEAGRGSALYIPAGNELAVDMTDSPITGATRHYNKLIIFKPDCTAAVQWEPMQLADGTTISAFTVRTIQKAIGSESHGTVPIVNNNPRTLCSGGLYEWKLPSTLTQNERYAKNIGGPVCRALRESNLSNAICADDTLHETFYIVLNDENGTILVNRYNASDTWCMYQSDNFKSIASATVFRGSLVLQNAWGMVLYLDETSRYDSSPDDENKKIPISAQWYTGYMDFGKYANQKFSSTLWVSILPEAASNVTITAETDRRSEYANKETGSNVFSYKALSYNYFTYEGNDSPKINRIKLKVKKFTHYMLKFEINKPGASATILSYTQQVRFGSEVK